MEDPNISSPTNAIIGLMNVKRYFSIGSDVVKAIDDISFSLVKGDFITITGASGSGKTTLLNLIGLLDSPSDGVIRIDDQEVNDLSPKERSAIRLRKIGFIFQFFNLQHNLSAMENVMIPYWLAGHSRQESETRAIQMLTRVGIAHRLRHLPSELSGGQQQRVAIARALINSPSVILADEPTGNLDSDTTSEIIDLFEELNREGQTIIMVTHERDITERSKRTLKLKDGKVWDDQ